MNFSNNIYQKISQEITDVYLGDSRPWVIGFSGGKDSTALFQLIYYSISSLQKAERRKHIYVIASDTRVEIPSISKRIKKEIELILKSAKRDGLPISTHLLYPKLNDTFWVNLIGRGYPSPNTHFRWCTDRLKIRPASDFIRKVVDKSGSVIVVLGMRKDESATRARSLAKHDIKGNRFRPHNDLPKAYVYTPIEDFSSDQVWDYLLNEKNPWAGDNTGLLELYTQASGIEGTMTIDTSSPPSGYSRFGCWTCTVVQKDMTLESLIFSGDKKLEPLFELRNYLREIRNEPGARYDERRNGAIPIKRGTNEVMTNTGPFTHRKKMEILNKVLEAQKRSGITIIEGDELEIIHEIWNKEENYHPSKPEIPTNAVQTIYNKVVEDSYMLNEKTISNSLEKEDVLLKQISEEHNISFEMMRKLRDIEEEHGHLKRRHGLPDQMREIIEQYVSEIEGK